MVIKDYRGKGTIYLKDFGRVSRELFNITDNNTRYIVVFKDGNYISSHRARLHSWSTREYNFPRLFEDIKEVLVYCSKHYGGQEYSLIEL